MRGHKNARNDLDAAFIREIFDYDPVTGALRWKVKLARQTSIGSIAGMVDDQGRVKVGIRNNEYFAHRIIWVWMTGAWPEREVDHRNEIKSDNRWENLREASPSQNHRNRGKQQNNTSGYKGVTWDRKRQCWIAGIKLNGYRHNLGSFESAEAAHEAYCAAAIRLHGPDWMKT